MQIRYEASVFGTSLRAGLAALRRRPGLVLLLYGADLALAFLLAVPLYGALTGTAGAAGFSPDLARGFDLVLWMEVMEQAGKVFGALAAQLFWLLPFYLVWKTAVGVGLVEALRGDGGAFWQAVGRYTGRGVLLTLGFAALLVGVLFGFTVAYAAVAGTTTGEVALVWWNAFVLPLLFAGCAAVLDLTHDYARIALVVEDRPVRSALRLGLAWPFRHGPAAGLYALWLVPAVLLVAAPAVFDSLFAAATPAGIALLFVVQQLCLLLRAAATVGWTGSEVACFETIRAREAPLLAAGPAAPDGPDAPSDFLPPTAPAQPTDPVPPVTPA